MISVIIPCYNCSSFIGDTIQSILEQTYQDFEIIIIDDGSTDDTAVVINQIRDERIVYQKQPNGGVSAARNNGLQRAKGDYVVFFDGDDLMSANFLQVRIEFLEQRPDIGFCCGPIETFPMKKVVLYGAAKAVAEELLLYDPLIASCPSNYMIRRSMLTEHSILFNQNLSSTADRFFLLQLAKKAKGFLLGDGPLFYRVSDSSMSNLLTKKLVDDNELFLIELEKHSLIPNSLKKAFLFKIHYILGNGYLKLGSWSKGCKYLVFALNKNPLHFITNILSRFNHTLSLTDRVYKKQSKKIHSK